MAVGGLIGTSTLYDVLWSPTKDDQFLLCGLEDVGLFSVSKEKSKGSIDLGDLTYGVQLHQVKEGQDVKCVEWYPKANKSLVAIGSATGHVTIHRMDRRAGDLGVKELAPKQPRVCLDISWNQCNTNLLAAAFDKGRGHPAVVVWDLVQDSDLAYPSGAPGSGGGIEDSAKSLYEIGGGECGNSVAWYAKSDLTLLCGMSKYLRVYDVRHSVRKATHATGATRGVHGACFDPTSDYRVASYGDNHVYVWDTRKFEKPMHLYEDKKPIKKLQWCPTRAGFLASLSTDSSSVKIYDVKDVNLDETYVDSKMVDRTITLFEPSNKSFGSFDWHPSKKNQLITLTKEGSLKNRKVRERMSVHCDSHSMPLWTSGTHLRYVPSISGDCPDLPEEYGEDVVEMMYKRAMTKYGTTRDVRLLRRYGEHDKPGIKEVWEWIATMKSLERQQVFASSADDEGYPFRGLASYIPDVKLLSASRRPYSEEEIVTWGDPVWQPASFRRYRSQERSKCSLLCGWPLEDDDLMGKANRLVAAGEYERAAAICVFHLQLIEALSILNKGAKARKMSGDLRGLNLSVVAATLSGFTTNKSPMWVSMCERLKEDVADPYILAILLFLVDEGDFSAVLNESNGMKYQDRVGFACRYLSDKKLSEYMRSLSMKLVKEGNLLGICVTGLSHDGVSLLQSYVDQTADIQTPALVVAQTIPYDRESINRPCIKQWIEGYRNLLDSWQLWFHRCRFERFVGDLLAKDKESKLPIRVACNFCGKNLQGKLSDRRYMGAGGNMPPGPPSQPKVSQFKITMCQACFKGSSRCSYCSSNMGTSVDVLADVRQLSDLSSSPPHSNLDHPHDSLTPGGLETTLTPALENGYGMWFTWCVNCRHGGHVAHLTEWFRENEVCAITGCKCKCESTQMWLEAADEALTEESKEKRQLNQEYKGGD